MRKPLFFTALGVALGVMGSISYILHKTPTQEDPAKMKRPTVDMRALSAARWSALPEDFGAKTLYHADGVYDLLKTADRIAISVADPTVKPHSAAIGSAKPRSSLTRKTCA